MSGDATISGGAYVLVFCADGETVVKTHYAAITPQGKTGNKACLEKTAGLCHLGTIQAFGVQAPLA
jgi:hypothetical protein